MDEYKRFFTKLAEKDLDKLDAKLGSRILEKIAELTANPKPNSCKKLKNTNYYRVRVGDYRVVYEIDDKDKSVTIYKIRHRKDVYK